MVKVQDIEIPLLQFAEAAAPSTPAAGLVRIYAKADGKLYSKDDAGAETELGPGSGGIPATIFDAKGDIIAASAADTAARLAVGANNLTLLAASGETTGLKWGVPVVPVTEYEASADTTLTSDNTEYDVSGLTASLAAGTYLVTAQVQFSRTGGGIGGASFAAAIVSGGTKVREASSVYDASWVGQINLTKKLVLGSTTTVKVIARAQDGGDTVTRYDPVFGDSVIATVMTVMQIA